MVLTVKHAHAQAKSSATRQLGMMMQFLSGVSSQKVFAANFDNLCEQMFKVRVTLFAWCLGGVSAS